jgi:serine/threonine protein phosphatase PrpC
MAELRWGAATDAGRIRASNEDHLWADGQLFAVADGMGGHQAGEVASALAVARLSNALARPDPTPDALVAAIEDANREIFAASTTDPDQQGMGTTITALALITPGDSESDAYLVLGNVGDSRTYRIRHGVLEQVTVDHSYVQELVAGGHISPAEARTHPRRNIVTRALGIEPEIEVDSWRVQPYRGDRYILCSDGLVDEVPDDDILEIAIAHSDPTEAAQALVDTANANGGHDNISVVVVDIIDGDEPPPIGTTTDTPANGTADAVSAGWDETTDEIPLVDDVDDGDHADDSDVGGGDGGDGAVSDDSRAEHDTEHTAGDTATNAEATAPTRRRSRLWTFILSVGAAAVLVFGAAIFAAWARSGYFVDFDDNDRVVVYKGQSSSILWFNPTVSADTGRTRSALDERSIELVEDRFRFDSLSAAERFVTERLEMAEDDDRTGS